VEAPPARKLPADARIVLEAGDGRVGTYVSRPWSFSTSSYWIEGPEGLVLIDTQFLPSAALEMVRWAEDLTAKKAVAAIVLHANPDKFNGTASLQERGIRVITSQQVAALIPAVHQKRLAAFYDRYQPDYPKDTPAPEVFGAATTTISLAGLELTLHVLGPGCSEAHLAVSWEGHLFAGDLIANGAHAWLEIGKTDQWLQRIDELEALEPDLVHPGRGPSGTAGLFVQQRNYLRRVIELIGAEKPARPDDGPGIARATERILAAFPGLRYEVFLRLGVKAEWNRQVQARTKRKVGS
jgi:glyoxylase-like metal-dependent hydrolase (beta-lactamase superfamily II)